MAEIENILIAGAGAIGTLVAHQFQQSLSCQVGILAGGERLERYRTRGFSVNGHPTGFRFVDVENDEIFDLVVVACKNHHLPRILEDVGRHVGPRTLFLSLLNGITSEEKIGSVFGAERIPYAMIVGTDAGFHDGRLDYTVAGTIVFGDARNDGCRSPRVAAIARAFERAGIRHQVPDDMLGRLWYKFMFNVGVNQVSAVLRRPFHVFQTSTSDPCAARLMDQAMREAAAVARAEGVILTESDIASVWTTLDTLSHLGRTSMLQDVLAGRKTEVELFSAQVIALADRHRIEAPVNRFLHDALRAIESTYGLEPERATA